MKVDITLLKKIHHDVSMGSTGSPDGFAEKLGISTRFLHLVLEYMKREFDAPIAYSRLKRSYYYTYEWEFYVGDLNRIKSQLVKNILEAINGTVKIIILLGIASF